jgi:hypothetical protein
MSEHSPLPGHAESAPAATQPTPFVAHCAHLPLQSWEQQTFLLHSPLWHSVPAEHAEPFGLSEGTHAKLLLHVSPLWQEGHESVPLQPSGGFPH